MITSAYQILLAEGTVLQKDYIENLNDLGIAEVYIQEAQKEAGEKLKLHTREMEIICKAQVKNVLEKHIYRENKELEKLRGYRIGYHRKYSGKKIISLTG